MPCKFNRFILVRLPNPGGFSETISLRGSTSSYCKTFRLFCWKELQDNPRECLWRGVKHSALRPDQCPVGCFRDWQHALFVLLSWLFLSRGKNWCWREAVTLNLQLIPCVSVQERLILTRPDLILLASGLATPQHRAPGGLAGGDVKVVGIIVWLGIAGITSELPSWGLNEVLAGISGELLLLVACRREVCLSYWQFGSFLCFSAGALRNISRTCICLFIYWWHYKHCSLCEEGHKLVSLHFYPCWFCSLGSDK